MSSVSNDRNIVLIGMPGSGKSTIGVLLAKALSRGFLDTDVLIQSMECRRLQDIIDALGMASFRALEERYLLTLHRTGEVIATGGSVIYSDAAMEHLRTNGTTVFLDLLLDTLLARITDMDSRGVVMAPGQTFEALYAERLPRYRHFADVTVACHGLTHEQVVQKIRAALVK